MEVNKAGLSEPEALDRRIPDVFVAALSILVLILAGQWLQAGVHLNHDVSYFVHFDGWLLQGRTLGTDLHDGNLPMVWGLFMPSALLVHWNLLSEPAAVRLAFWAYFFISAMLTLRVLSLLGDEWKGASVGWVVAFVLIATLGPGFSFGQREHACVLFAMPYLALAVVRLQRGKGPGVLTSITIGLLAGIGFAIKPYFLAVPALVELLLLIRLGGRSLLSRTESLVLAGTVMVYVMLAAILLRDYLELTLGLTKATYWAYDTPDRAVLLERYLRVAQPALYGAAIALVTRTWSPQHTVLLLAGLGFTASYFVQSKGFVYQAYPVLVCTMTFLGICLGQGLARAWRGWRATRKPLWPALGAAVVLIALPPLKQAHDDVASWYFTHNIAWGPTGQFRQAIIDTVDHFAPTRGTYFFAFSTHPFPGFPTASYSRAEWTGRSVVQPVVPALARLAEVTDPERRARVIRAGEYQRRIVVEDFERRPPSIVFAERTLARLGMNGRPFDDIAFYLSDPRFRQIWARYEEYPPMGPFRVFVLRDTAR